MVTSDGKELLWAVFNSDGYECSHFIGVFDSASEALKAKTRIEELTRKFYTEHMPDCEWHGSVEVMCVVVGEYEMPPDAKFALAEAS